MTIKQHTDAQYYFPQEIQVRLAREEGQITARTGIVLIFVYNEFGDRLRPLAKYDLQLTQAEIDALMNRLALRRVDFEAEEGLELLPVELDALSIEGEETG